MDIRSQYPIDLLMYFHFSVERTDAVFVEGNKNRLRRYNECTRQRDWSEYDFRVSLVTLNK